MRLFTCFSSKGVGGSDTLQQQIEKKTVASVQHANMGAIDETDEPGDTVHGGMFATNEPGDTVHGGVLATNEPGDTVHGRILAMEDAVDTVHGGGIMKWLIEHATTQSFDVPLCFGLDLPAGYTTRLTPSHTVAATVGHTLLVSRDPTRQKMQMWFSTASQQGQKGVCQDTVMVWPEFLAGGNYSKHPSLPLPPAPAAGGSVEVKSVTVQVPAEAAPTSTPNPPAEHYRIPMMGVYDGHGGQGHKVANLVRDLVPLALKDVLEPLSESEAVVDWDGMLQQAYAACDQRILELDGTQKCCINTQRSGTTGNTVVLDGDRLTMCSVGDSRIVLGKISRQTGSVAMVACSREHRPTDLDERRRLSRSGGVVRSVPTEPNRQRFWPTDVQDAIDGKCELSSPGLCMSRAFGDSVLKGCGLIVDPYVATVKLDPNETYILIISSDGVWDVISNIAALQLVAKQRLEENASQVLINQATSEWTSKYPFIPMDDMGVATAIIKGANTNL